jgi:hypothetical protein
MIYEPGPFAIRTPMPLGPPVVPPGLFLSDAAALAPTVAGLDQGWGTTVATIAPIADRSLDADYNADVAPAFTGLDLFDTPAENADFARIAGAADVALEDAAQQVLDLPGAGEGTPGTIGGTTPDPGDVPGFD